jgi:hypothetical protein
LALPLFAVTLFTSAFLLFMVQPIIGALILPKLGGTPQVWNTCMVFFQTALLAGYAYTHSVSTWLPTRRQVVVHCLLLLLPLGVLLFAFTHGPFDVSWFKPPYGANPIPYTLAVLAAVVGLPFFVVATSAPLLQKWFASTGHPAAKDPYFLYAASNLGSMLGLLTYPAVVQPLFRLHATETFDLGTQPWLWTAGYVVMVGLFLACAVVVLRAPPSVQFAGVGGTRTSALAEGNTTPALSAQAEPAQASGTAVTTASQVVAPKATGIKKGSKQGKHAQQQSFAKRDTGKSAAAAVSIVKTPASDDVTPARRIRWVALAAVPSSLMLGVTTYMSTDISAIPLFWVIPLSFYLLSFILVFLRWPVPWVGEPHRIVLLLQPFALLLLVFVTLVHPGNLLVTTLILVATFFMTALACHGELAKDRPSTKHLTEFYLWMSVGGMVGGMFNALVAPVLFTYVMEFGIALVVAGLVLPRTKVGGWTDNLLSDMSAKSPGQSTRPAVARGGVRKPGEAEARNPLHTVLDVALPVGLFVLAIVLLTLGGWIRGVLESLGGGFGMTRATRASFAFYGGNVLLYVLPLVFCFLYAGRPLRFGLGIGAVLLASGAYTWATDKTRLYSDRSYFSIIRVKQSDETVGAPFNTTGHYTQLIHANINHGMNFSSPEGLKRLPTTYYHRKSPVGYVMEKFTWFHDPKTPVEIPDPKTGKAKPTFVYWSDTRMPASLVGLGSAPLGVGMLPVGQLVGAWSEPAYATIGLGTGTMACYGRPYQHMHFYEIDSHIRRLSLPPLPGEEHPLVYWKMPEYNRKFQTAQRRRYFTNLADAIERGVELHVLMGDARLRMAQPWTPSWEPDHWDKTGGPDGFYHALIVDAFSSDAIPVHLITKDAFELYFRKLSEEGILCMHTSNRYVDLVRVCADLAESLGYAWRRGHTKGASQEALNDGTDPGHFSSEWVMIARKQEYMGPQGNPIHWSGLVAPGDAGITDERQKYWSDFVYWSPRGGNVWTDDRSNMMGVFRPFIRDSGD